MKKFAKILALTLVVGLLTGCAGTPVVVDPNAGNTEVSTEVTTDAETEATADAEAGATADAETSATSSATTETVVAEGAVKTGLAILGNLSKSKDTTVEYDVTLVAVLVDDNGVIVDCAIDAVGTKVNFNEKGEITTDINAAVSTKNELGENYGMVAWGGAVAEWDAQAEALAQHAIGKTVEELKNGSIDASGKAVAGTDLASTATMYLGGYVAGIEAAVANAKHLGAQAGDEVRLASVNGLGSSKAATADKAGNSQLDTEAVALSVKDGVITSCTFDALQAKVAFTADGITSDVTAAPKTKNQLGADYGMVAWGGAIAEWDAQAASFAAYVTGKTLAEVEGIAVDAATHPTEADLVSSVTITVGGFQETIKKALQ